MKFLLLVFAAVAAVSPPAQSKPGIAFDQIDRVMFGTTIQPSLDAFSSDRAAIIAEGDLSHFPAPAAGAQAKGTQSHSGSPFGHGTLLRYAYLGEWTRVDDPLKQTSTISRPDLHQIFYLDLAKKTFRIATLEAAKPAADLKSLLAFSKHMLSTHRPGTGVLTMGATSRVLAPKTYEGMAVRGTSQTFSTTISAVTGSCRPMRTSMTMLSYVLPNISELDAKSQAAAVRSLGSPDAMMQGMLGGCRLRQIHKSIATPPMVKELAGGLSVYRLIETQTTIGTMATPKFSFLSERGNIKMLSAQDHAVFEIPADFLKAP